MGAARIPISPALAPTLFGLSIDSSGFLTVAATGWATLPGPAGDEVGSGLADRLLERYRDLDLAFLDGVTGAFSAVVWDAARERALAFRGGLGDAYLAYRLTADELAVGSCDASLAGEAAGALDPLRLAGFYAFADLDGDETFFADVRSLPPGELLVVERERVARRAVPQFDLAARLELPSWEQYVERFAELLERAVARSLAGVDRVAIWCGGGLDSAPLAALAAARLGGGRAVDLLSWRPAEPLDDERAAVESTARACGAALHWIPCEDALPFSDLPRWPVHPSSPEQNPYRHFHQRSYARAAELGHHRTLWGISGDSLYTHARDWFPSLLHATGPGPAIDRLRELATTEGWARALRNALLAPLRSAPARPDALPEWLTAEARERLRDRRSWPADLAAARRPRQARRLLALMEAHGSELEASYAARHGLTVGAPFRDPELVAFALAVPDHVLHQGRWSRAVLRDAMAGRLPEPVRRRTDKASFAPTFHRGLEPANRPWAERLLLAPDALWRGFVRESAVRGWLARCPTGEPEDLGFYLCLAGELWRFTRAGGRLADLA